MCRYIITRSGSRARENSRVDVRAGACDDPLQRAPHGRKGSRGLNFGTHDRDRTPIPPVRVPGYRRSTIDSLPPPLLSARTAVEGFWLKLRKHVSACGVWNDIVQTLFRRSRSRGITQSVGRSPLVNYLGVWLWGGAGLVPVGWGERVTRHSHSCDSTLKRAASTRAEET